MSLPQKGAGGSAAGGPLIHYDTFTEAGNPNIEDHTPEIGGAYVEGSEGGGSFDILSASNVLDSTTLSYKYAWTEASKQPRQIKMDWRQPNGFAPMGHLFRFVDEDNFWLIKWAYWTNDVWLNRVVANVATTIDSDLNLVHIAETWYTVWIEDDGGNIDIYHATKGSAKPGSPILQATADTIHNTAKKVGFYADINSQRYDNLNIWRTVIE